MTYKTTVVVAATLTTLAALAFPDAARADYRLQIVHRLPEWTEREFESTYEAHEFRGYMEGRGFQVQPVRHHRSCSHVLYRLPCWTTFQNVYCPKQACRIVDDLRRQGFEARVICHD